MIIASATKAVETPTERIHTCPRDGAAYLPSRGCRICAWDARYAAEPLGICPECGAVITGEISVCGGCNPDAAGAALHAVLLAEARADVAAAVAVPGRLGWAVLADRVVGESVDDVRFAELVEAV